MEVVAHIYTDFSDKFGIPRQSGLVGELKGTVVFEPKYRTPDAVKGLEEFDYVWLLWKFECSEKNSITVRPPRLGGNIHMGVFATRAPYRPNNIGLSSVRLEKIEYTDNGPVLHVLGADLRNNTPIYDIKPYLAYTDSHPDAKCGFSDDTFNNNLEVVISSKLLNTLPEDKRLAAVMLLKQDPRPAYHCDPDRVYGMNFSDYNIRFNVDGKILTVVDVEKLD